MNINEFIEEIRTRSKESDLPLVIAATGGSATGKSSYLTPLLKENFANEYTVVEQDWYQIGEDFVESTDTIYRWDDPRNFQINRLAEDIKILKTGSNIVAPSFNLDAVGSIGENIVKPNKIIIVDGIYANYAELKEQIDLSVYISAPFYGRFLRRLFRMVYEHNIPKPRTAFKQMFSSVYFAHRDFVSKQRDYSDCIIELDYSFEESIKRYNLIPLNEKMPESAEKLWQQKDEDLSFFIDQKNENFTFYIVYSALIYYKFEVEIELIGLLEGVDIDSI